MASRVSHSKVQREWLLISAPLASSRQQAYTQWCWRHLSARLLSFTSVTQAP